jgi:hypothetical protein
MQSVRLEDFFSVDVHEMAGRRRKMSRNAAFRAAFTQGLGNRLIRALWLHPAGAGMRLA